MKQKHPPSILRLCAIVLAFAGTVLATEQPRAARPNVILIMTDDQGYGDFSCHGNPVLKTPNMDRLHSESVRFTDFHVAPMCSPTRGQLMTGRDGMKNGCTAVCQGRSMPRSDIPMMAEYFADSGYATGHFGKWHMGDSYPFRPQDRGFQETLHHRAWGITSLADHWENHTDVYFDPVLNRNGVDERYEGYCTDIFFDEAIEWIEGKAKAEEPFFVYLPTNTPHVPNVCPEKYSAPYIGEHEGKKMPAEFYGMIANLDENLGKLEAFLEEKGLRENTILIYLTDNGTQSTQAKEIFNAGMRDKKTSVYEGGHRVPLFVRWPAGELAHGRDIDDLTQVQDLLPTLVELCGLEEKSAVADFDGKSLTGLLKGTANELPDRKLVIQYRVSGEPWDPGVVLWNKWRLVNGRELYHVGRDPSQTANVAGDHPDVVAAMSSHYDDWHAEAKPLFDKPRWIEVGTEQENPMMLYAQDWVGDYCDNMGGLTKGTAVGYWNVDVEQAGVYELELRRWPVEADLPLAAGMTPDRIRGQRPIAAANVQIGGANYTLDAATEGTHVTFYVALQPGQDQLLTHFLDDQDQTLCSAMYVKLTRLPESADAVLTPVSERKPAGVAKPSTPPAGRAAVAPGKPIQIGKDDILIADFEGDGYGGWTTTGGAFGAGPTATKGRIVGHQGKQVVDTFLINNGDNPTGTLTSPPFTIERRYLNLLIGGGRHPEGTGVALRVNGKEIRTATGNSTKNAKGQKILQWVSWDLSALKGKQAQIEIFDRVSGGWGHIVVDQIFQSDSSPK